MIQAYPKKHLIAAGSLGALMTIVLLLSPSPEVEAKRTSIDLKIEDNTNPVFAKPEIDLSIENVSQNDADNKHFPEATPPKTVTQAKAKPVPEPWKTFKIKNGDTLSVLFKHAGLDNKVMYQVLGKGNRNKQLTKIYPGEKIGFSVKDGQLEKVKLIRSKLESIVFSRDENGDFSSHSVKRDPEVHTAYREGVIESSLFLAGQKAGMSQSQIMELANIFGWDIDFVLDIRKGDTFSLVFEELHLDGAKFKNGKIIAASFTNQGRKIEALLYKQKDGISNYYSPDGKSMRKAFLRTPVDFSRISSHFNPRRMHPVLNRVRAHKGTDYAAPTGTPVKASGDGKVVHASRKGGYGKTVILQHGQKFTTLYAHLNGYGKGVRVGKRVKQGQIIGYVGSTGVSTGPHLHYEFRVNGVHKNPVKVKLPQAKPVNKDELARFRSQTENLLAQLNTYRESYQVALND